MELQYTALKFREDLRAAFSGCNENGGNVRFKPNERQEKIGDIVNNRLYCIL